MGVLVVTAGVARAAEKAVAIQEVGPAIFQAPAVVRAAPQPSDLVLAAPRLPEAARHPLGELTVAERDELLSPDRRGGVMRRKAAMKVGISRPLPAPVGFSGLPALSAGESRAVSGGFLERVPDGSLAWTASFSSTGAGALRLHLLKARLPAGSRAYVYGEDGEIQGPYDFTSGTRPEGFWTNTIFADRIFLEVRFPATATAAELGKALLVLGTVAHLEHPDFAPSSDPKASSVRPKSDACFIDRSCVTAADFPNVDMATRSIGQLTFMDPTDHQYYICTGGLLNTTAGSSIPYLLTANHCFDTQASASSLEAFWQYRTATCNGAIPNENQFPRTLGSQLLATGSYTNSSDFTFVRLSQSPPADSVALGWTTANVTDADGLVLYRLSYAGGNPMIYTREQVTANPTPLICDPPHDRFIYQKDIEGGTGGGSSGSPLYLEDLRVVGQEFGECGTNDTDNCDAVNNSTEDGAFRTTFPLVQQWLVPGTPGPCVPTSTSLCLSNARFRVSVYYATKDGRSGAGMGTRLTGDSGTFWFFDAANIELIVKVLDGCGVNGHFWVFAGGLTDVGVTLLVEDTVTGASRTYINPVGTAFQPLQDTLAFSCP
jgi:hypothetical protein